MAGLVCFKCGASLKDIPRPITRLSHCPDCYAELHCCLMCRKYTERYHTRCTDERTDPPERKDTANFCDYFVPRPDAFDPQEKAADQAARERLAGLFGEAPPSDEGPSDEEARQAAESLFGKKE